MASQSQFEGLAQNYAQYRPKYPVEIIQKIRELIGLEVIERSPLLVDVGCGTGIATRMLRRVFGEPDKLRIVGIEPSDDMRSQAIAGTDSGERIEYRKGVAESLPLPDESAALVMAAQAAHWFDRPTFYAEAARVLASGGLIAILYNNRRHDDALQEEFTQLLERVSPGYQRTYRGTRFGDEIRDCGAFAPSIEFQVDWQLSQTCDQFLGFCFSTTYIRRAIEASNRAAIEDELIQLWSKHVKPSELLTVRYETELIAARRL